MRFFELNYSELVPETRVERIWIAYDAADDVVSPASLKILVTGEEETDVYENEHADVVEDVYNGIVDSIESGEIVVSVPIIISDVLKMRAA